MEVLIFLVCLGLIWFLWPIVWRLAFWSIVFFGFLCFQILVHDWESRALGRALYAEKQYKEAVYEPTQEEIELEKAWMEFLTGDGPKPEKPPRKRSL